MWYSFTSTVHQHLSHGPTQKTENNFLSVDTIKINCFYLTSTSTLFKSFPIPVVHSSFSLSSIFAVFFFRWFVNRWLSATRNDSSSAVLAPIRRNSVGSDPMGSIVVEDADTDTVYVAVGKNAEKTQQLLHWTVTNFSGKNVCLLHIHRPYSLNSFCEFLLSYIF